MVFVFICLYMALEGLRGAAWDQARGEVCEWPENLPERICEKSREEECLVRLNEKFKNRLKLINTFSARKRGVKKLGTVKISLSIVKQMRVKYGTSGIKITPLRATFGTSGSETAPKKIRQKQQERFKYVTIGVILTHEVYIWHLF